jgi:hypothetical protein
MNESTVSSKFQTELRKARPGTEVIKHADKSMIGMVDASITANKRTVWVEYKFIAPNTKGVTAEFMAHGEWSPQAVAGASPTQFETAKRLATFGHCCYLFWVLDHKALRKRVAYITLWHPITGAQIVFKDTVRVVDFFRAIMGAANPLELVDH